MITSALKHEPVPKSESKTLFDHFNANKGKDKYYSIYRNEDGIFVLGSVYIQIDAGNNISIGDETYPYSKGLGNLLRLNEPKIYTMKILPRIKRLLKKRNLLIIHEVLVLVVNEQKNINS